MTLDRLLASKNAVVIGLAAFLAVSCASQPTPVEREDPEYSLEQQREAQRTALANEQAAAPTLKRKVAIGRVTNETRHGRSILRSESGDTLGKQVADMLTQKLVESGQFLVLERPDIDKLQAESNLSGNEFNIVGADTLILGSLVEFGRNTTGTKGFWSKSKKQTASAKVSFRLVDTQDARAYFSATGAGEASSETGEIAFAGSTASYDGKLNDGAIDAAVSDVVDEIIQNLTQRPWQTSVLTVEGSDVYIASGKSQGVKPGMRLAVERKGKRVKSGQSGFMITLPGKRVATLEVVSLFGTTETDEGAIARVVDGTLAAHPADSLTIVEDK